jgi:molybdopterin-binding protein
MKKKISIIPAITREQLRVQVERLVHGDGLTYTEALIEICENREIDPEDIAKIVKGPLKNKLEVEAVDRNIIKSDTAELY